jgi:hypothetical protein
MAVSKERKAKYNEEAAFLKRKIDEINQRIKYLESQNGEDQNIVSFKIVSQLVDLVSIYCAMTDLSKNLLGYKNENFLDTGRKTLYKALIQLEGIVSNVIDLPLSENYELLSVLDSFSDADRLKLMKKIGYTVSLLQDRYGENSKWKWSFVEIEGRYAVVAKNMFNFRLYQEKNDPNTEGFDERYDYLFLVKELLERSSNRYREKYELTNHSPEDMKKALDFLRALKRIHMLFNEKNEVQNVTKRIDLWSQKLEVDLKAKEKQLKKKRVGNEGKRV